MTQQHISFCRQNKMYFCLIKKNTLHRYRVYRIGVSPAFSAPSPIGKYHYKECCHSPKAPQLYFDRISDAPAHAKWIRFYHI